jgi:regulator of sigma E protease
MEIAIKTSQFFMSLSLLVVLHEMGHFLAARAFGMRVEAFYLFFNPWFSIVKKKIGDTVYGIGWLPLGGYVKISGMIDESMDKEQMAKPPQPWEFRSKPAWQRLIVMIGGVVVNVLLAILIYWMSFFAMGEKYLPPANAVYGVKCDTSALEIGLRDGDIILGLDGVPVERFTHIIKKVLFDESSSIQISRGGEEMEFSISEEQRGRILERQSFVFLRFPFIANAFTAGSGAKAAGIEEGDLFTGVNDVETSTFDEFATEVQKHKSEEVAIHVMRDGTAMQFQVQVSDEGRIGVYPVQGMDKFAEAGIFEIAEVKYGFFESLPRAFSKAGSEASDYGKQAKLIGKSPESLGGFWAILNIFPGEYDWEIFWSRTAWLSIVLAVMNILPIPALDGGHVMFLLYEMITKRQPNERFMEIAQTVGMLLLFSLLIFANGNDIYKGIMGWLGN